MITATTENKWILPQVQLILSFDSKIHILEAKHCPATSDVRALISRPLPVCQSETILRLFDENYTSEAPKCSCCYSCMKQHSNSGCQLCSSFLDKFFPPISSKRKKSVASELREALDELFSALGAELLLLEDEVEISSKSFIKDFIKMSDEVKSENDIVEIWHIDRAIASSVFEVFEEVLFGESEMCDDDSFNNFCNDISDDDEISDSDSD